ncbi:acyl-CoA dehydrogenase family protein [Actinomadura macra]|uniref:acyl-CoA dehydrogenase family protein n=1 Tax=Actinomadura macra TaxID=46164 RepID=UPI00082A34B6|nr:acyl-CoA dehydrogenase family protein [Actinomadura macra]
MDFTLGEELETVRDLARQIFTDHATQDRVRAVERSGTGVDDVLWTELAAAGLIGVALPEDAGGAGLGIAALCVLLEEQGRAVAPVPLWPSIVAALTLAAHGTLPPSAADGSARYTLALEEFGPHDPAGPWCAAVRDGEGWRLTGTKAVVPAAFAADHVLVSARSPDGPGLFLLDAGAHGTSWERAETTSRDIAAHLTLDGAPARALGAGALATVLRLARVALASVQVGVADGALRMAADHLARREQFGRPLATFQAVQHQLADCFMEIDALRVCLWHAVSLLAAGEDAESAVLVAKWWSGEGGLNVVHRVQHLHGGIGVDVDYPVHRHFLWGKQISGTLGGASADLDVLGATL